MHPADSPIKNRLSLNTGRKIYLKEFYQDLTYSGLLEGLPNPITNKEIISKLKNIANEKLWYLANPYTIRPKEKLIITELSDFMKEYYKSLEIDGPAEFPRVRCFSNFESTPVDKNYCMSSLTIIWFQEDWAMPIDETIINKIKCIDWNKYAIDADF